MSTNERCYLYKSEATEGHTLTKTFSIRRRIAEISLLSLAVSFGAVAPALSQTAQPTASTATPVTTTPPIETIVVIGTRARLRSITDSPVPVDVFGASQLQSTGAIAGELGAALSTVAPSFNFPRQSNSGTSDHIRAGQLRGLNPDQMLVLVNGKRQHNSAVVNSETKIGRGTAAFDFNTVPLSAVKRVEVLRDGAGAQYGSDAIAGVVNIVLDNAPKGGSASLTVGGHLTNVAPIDKNVSDGQTLHVDGSYGFEHSRGFVRVGFEGTTREATNRAGFDTIPFFIDDTQANRALRGKVNYALGDPASRGINVWFNSQTAVGSYIFYGFATLGSKTSEGSLFFRYPDGFDNIASIYPNGFLPISTGKNFDYSGSSGVRGDIAGWSLDASLTTGINKFTYGAKNSLNASLGATSPTTFRSGQFQYNQTSLNLDLTRDVNFGGSGAPWTLAVGAELRNERFQSRRGDLSSYTAGPVDLAIGAQGSPGLTPEDEAKITRDVGALYADISTNLTRNFFVDFAARVENYSDFGTEASGKAAFLFRATDAVSVRGSVSNSIRAPGLQQIGFSDTTLNFGDNRALVRTRTLPVSSPLAIALGAKPLDAEKSVNYALGGSINTGGFSLTVDAFQIDIKDRITLSDRFFGDGIAAFIASRPGGAGIASVRFFTNAADTQTRGVDVIARQSFQAFSGRMTLELAGTFAETKITSLQSTPAQLRAFDPTFALVGVEERNTINDAAPKSKIVGSVGWRGGNWSLLTRVSHYGEATRVFNFGGGFEPSQTYSAKTQVDGEVEYALNDNLSVAIGGSNLFDEYPDLSSDDINYFGNLPYDFLSPIGVNGRYVYGRIKIKL
jgi:iron complex outermembrane recepter protein